MSEKPRVDLGHGVSVTMVYLDGQPEGLEYWHPCTREGGSWIPVSEHSSGKYWKLESLEPLTISPSVLCQSCGHHGFIREGKWVPA